MMYTQCQLWAKSRFGTNFNWTNLANEPDKLTWKIYLTNYYPDKLTQGCIFSRLTAAGGEKLTQGCIFSRITAAVVGNNAFMINGEKNEKCNMWTEPWSSFFFSHFSISGFLSPIHLLNIEKFRRFAQ